jgi:hypothetical protein
MSFNPEAFDQGAFDPAAFDFTEGGGGGGAGSVIGGTAVDETGVMQTAFLADGQAVPGTAVFINGFAHTADGLRYVAAWPSNDVVFYVRGIARRADGAMCINAAGAIAAYSGGLALTDRGEVIVSTAAPQLALAGFGLRQAGNLCVSEAA